MNEFERGKLLGLLNGLTEALLMCSNWPTASSRSIQTSITQRLAALRSQIADAVGTPSAQRYTVMLLPPDRIIPHCTDSFLAHVETGDRSDALEAAIELARKHYGIAEHEAFTSDWRLLMLCEGHIDNLVDAGYKGDEQ